MIGLTLEWFILYATFIEFSAGINNIYSGALEFFSIAIISSLLMHQILIFRNFSVAGPPSFDRPFLWFLTFCIFIGIGAIAGEFGYLFAISKLSHIGVDGGITSSIMEMIGTNKNFLLSHELVPKSSNVELEVLKRSLKGIFVIGAFVVCLFVIFWDLLVYSERQKLFGGNLWTWFIVMDTLSLIIWFIVSTMIIPKFIINKDLTVMSFLITVGLYIGYKELKDTEKNS